MSWPNTGLRTVFSYNAEVHAAIGEKKHGRTRATEMKPDSFKRVAMYPAHS